LVRDLPELKFTRVGQEAADFYYEKRGESEPEPAVEVETANVRELTMRERVKRWNRLGDRFTHDYAEGLAKLRAKKS
jgi:hypothetical protein